ncbi:S-layer homology domain-containing protein [Bacillaceae bacterium SIJ1]|uniref:S-layer homology domain-containing protein n=1 Tax=Litoribacterium kuwaitense TaxID=1398745 RepID=UPI0013EA5637|nr:S-layer homology domain-containing protein [Litoribacterium kuwaitense]NGP46131.1 S-layer homology domain-containing protein [Litoribacterium kuwaitense]
MQPRIQWGLSALVCLALIVIHMQRVDAAPLTDVNGHWAEDELNDVIEQGWMKGYVDGSFGVNRKVTRAEMATIMSRAFEQLPKQQSALAYTDVPTFHWAFDAIQYSSSVGLMKGATADKFRPNREMTRAELAQMVSRLIPENEGDETIVYSDVPSGFWAVEAINKVSLSGYLTGYSDQTFHPNKSVTRAEVAVVLDRLKQKPSTNRNAGV